MRNNIPVKNVLCGIYIDAAEESKVIPTQGVPGLLKQARPLSEFVKVDVWLPGCPPPARAILELITNLLEGKQPAVSEPVRFG
jgi:NAD-reducing hydrogenase small subunit